MISKYFLFSLFFFALAFIGVECSLYLIFIFCSIVLGFVFSRFDVRFATRFIFSFLLHLLLNKNRWMRTNPIFDRLPTSSVKRRLNERVNSTRSFSRQWNFLPFSLKIFDGENETRPKDERETLTGNEEIDQPIHEVRFSSFEPKSKVGSNEFFVSVRRAVRSRLR